MNLQLFTTDGRLPRAPYLVCFLAMTLALAFIHVLAAITTSGAIRALITLGASLPVLGAGYCFSVRRAHDTGTGPTVVVWMFISLYTAMALLLMLDPRRIYGASFSVTDAILTTAGLFLACTSLFLLLAPTDDGHEFD